MVLIFTKAPYIGLLDRVISYKYKIISVVRGQPPTKFDIIQCVGCCVPITPNIKYQIIGVVRGQPPTKFDIIQRVGCCVPTTPNIKYHNPTKQQITSTKTTKYHI